MRGEIAFGAPYLRGWSSRLCTGAAAIVIIDALVHSQLFDGFGLSFCRILLPFFVRLSIAAPLWGGVMLCIVFGCC